MNAPTDHLGGKGQGVRGRALGGSSHFSFSSPRDDVAMEGIPKYSERYGLLCEDGSGVIWRNSWFVFKIGSELARKGLWKDKKGSFFSYVRT
ncbi:hypothetical protein CDAR_546651 [Caerostris darwini]|uniref:Uncharacterized protein n=1 Tax=Caerostris darwini TaxID=1538125 RepID=A0AAV4PDT5_9ARAC|nr:hypothetical protein CDAR_546651 [Caerostris darwini]